MSYTHLLYHIVFGTKGHLPLIAGDWEQALYQYLGGIIRNHKGELVEINGMAEHVHLLTRLEPVEGLADLLQVLKSTSSKWIRRRYEPSFSWQRRYGAFSVSESELDTVRDYIRTQKKHHALQSFDLEYRTLLRRHNVNFDERYLWD